MSEFWARIWRSWPRALALGCLASALIASVLYAFNWHTFFDTRAYDVAREAGRIAEDVDLLQRAVSDPAELRAVLRDYLAVRRARVSVTRMESGREAWQVGNAAEVDPARTLVERRFVLAEPGDGARTEVVVLRSVRPPLAVSLLRAWTFSVSDYRRDPERWWSHRYYNRSIPLYGYLLTVLAVGFGTIRLLHRNQLERDRLHTEAGDIERELAAARERSAVQIGDLKLRFERTTAQRDEAERERERLAGEVKAAEAEHEQLVADIATVERETRERAADEAADLAVENEQLRSIAARKARVERALAAHDATVRSYETELGGVRAELDAAEGLLQEVDARRDELLEKLGDRNRRIRQLQELVQRARRDANLIEVDAARLGAREAGEGSERALSALVSQLDRWVRGRGRAEVDFSEHSRAAEVAAHFERMDRAFVDRFFTHVTNERYQSAARRQIRVVSSAMGESGAGESGQLVVVLDEDAGRTLGLRFELVPGAPELRYVGFVLALLLRVHCRELYDFAIRVR